MAEITAALVKQLRDKTGAGMMDCKKVLKEAEGDLDRAVDLLRERGLGKARGKAGRATSEGRICAYVSDNAQQAVLLEINCETDFVARTPDFEGLCREIGSLALEKGADSAAALLALPLGSATVEARVVEAIAKLGENIQVRRVSALQAGADGRIHSYIHPGDKIGALVALSGGDSASEEIATLAHNLCMHVAASSPSSVSRDDLDASEIDRERSVLRAQAEQEGKPENVVEKMVEGRLNKFYKEVVLLEQPLVMDPDQSVKKVVEAAGGNVLAFRRFQLGEEIEG